jgi:hypothetical protein
MPLRVTRDSSVPIAGAAACLLAVALLAGCGGGSSPVNPVSVPASLSTALLREPDASTASDLPLAAATPFEPDEVVVSQKSPFAGTACGTASGTPTFDTAAEPQIAADPLNARNVVVVWQQDRFNADGGAVSNVVGVSHDGGNSFHDVLVKNLSLCTGGTDQRVSDPWLSWGTHGELYLSSLTFSEMPQNSLIAGPTTLVVQHSTDAGETWSTPVAVQPFDEIYNDRESVVADPTRRGYAYYTFVLRYGSQGESGFEEFSSTSDGGNTWTTPRPIYVPPPAMLTDPALIRVLPNGTLLNLIMIANLTPFLPSGTPRIDWQILSQRSTDDGKTWSNLASITTLYPAAPVDPKTGKVVRAYPLISEAVAPDGTAYVAWNEIPSAAEPSYIMLSRSSDGGVTWSQPAVVKQSPGQAFLPSLAVGADGTLAVTYDDTRNDKGTGTGDDFTTDVWFSISHDRGVTWTEHHLAGPFNMATAPESDSAGVQGLFVGDYQGLTALPGGFGAVFAQGRPRAIHGPTDLFFARFNGG